MPIRVLQVVTQMNRDGMESRLMDIYRHLDRARVQFDFYVFRLEEGQFDSEIMSLGGKIFYNKPLKIGSLNSAHNDFVNFLQQKSEYKIVHAHMNAWCGLLLNGAKKAGVPIRIAHSRTALDQLTFNNVIKNIVKIPVNKYATHRFAVSKKAAIWLFGKKTVERGFVQVWPNAIEYAKFNYDIEVRQEMRKDLNLDDSFVLMHVGNYRFEKNHRFLLKIFSVVKKQDISAKLVLVGRGDWTEVQRQSEQLGVGDSVVFTGSSSYVNRLLQAGDVFVFPSLYEGMPGAVLEAQAAGLPCIISDSITDEVCITPLVKQFPLVLSIEQWAEHVLACKNNSREQTLEYFLKSGFDIHSLVDKLTDFYLNTITENGESR